MCTNFSYQYLFNFHCKMEQVAKNCGQYVELIYIQIKIKNMIKIFIFLSLWHLKHNITEWPKKKSPSIEYICHCCFIKCLHWNKRILRECEWANIIKICTKTYLTRKSESLNRECSGVFKIIRILILFLVHNATYAKDQRPIS